MGAVPIDPNSRGALLQARDSWEEFNESLDVALPALQHCGVADVSLIAYELARDTARFRLLVERLVEGTTELKANQFPRSTRR